MVAQLLNGMVLRTESDIHTETLAALQQISAYEPKIFEEITLPNFMENLFDNSTDSQTRDQEIEVSLSLLQDLVYVGGTIPCRESGEPSNGVLSKNAGSYWPRNFNTLMEFFQENDFYLSQKECTVINKLRRTIELKYKNSSDGVRMIWDNLSPNKDMQQSYYLKE